MANANYGTLAHSNSFNFFRANTVTGGWQIEDWEPDDQTDSLPNVGARLTAIASTLGRNLIATIPSHSMVPTFYLPVSFNEMTLDATPKVASANNPAATAISRIIELSGMNRVDIAAKLLGVHRQSVWNWETDKRITTENLEKLLIIRDLLERAAEFQSSRPEENDLRWWLFTPRGESGVTPQELILKGKFSRARLLAMAAAPKKRVEAPDWLKGGPSSADAEMIQRVFDTYSEKDYGPHRDVDLGGE